MSYLRAEVFVNKEAVKCCMEILKHLYVNPNESYYVCYSEPINSLDYRRIAVLELTKNDEGEFIELLKNQLPSHRIWIQYRTGDFEQVVSILEFLDTELVYSMNGDYIIADDSKIEDTERVENATFDEYCKSSKDGIVQFKETDNLILIRRFIPGQKTIRINGSIVLDKRDEKENYYLFS